MSLFNERNESYAAERRRKETRERLDRSPSSSPVGPEQRRAFQKGNPEDAIGSHRTRWSRREAPSERIERFDEEMNKWEWLGRLHKMQNHTDRRGDNRNRGRANDFQILVDQVENITDKEQQWLYERCLNICRSISNDRENGFRFGATRPVEVVELAILSHAARSLINIDSFDERDMQNGIHNIAFDGTQMETLCDTWPPEDIDTTCKVLRELRGQIVSYLN